MFEHISLEKRTDWIEYKQNETEFKCSMCSISPRLTKVPLDTHVCYNCLDDYLYKTPNYNIEKVYPSGCNGNPSEDIFYICCDSTQCLVSPHNCDFDGDEFNLCTDKIEEKVTSTFSQRKKKIEKQKLSKSELKKSKAIYRKINSRK